MFNSLNEFQNWLEISRNFSKETIRDIFVFMKRFPLADVEAYIKAARQISKGKPVQDVMHSYQRHLMSVGESEDDRFFEIYKMEDCIEEMVSNAENGLLKGTTTHIPMFDECWKWRSSEFNLFTGYNADGKSLMLRYLSLIKGIMDKVKTAGYFPEDYPATSFFDELIHTASTQSTDRDYSNYIGAPMYRHVYNQIKDLFYFVYLRPPKNTLKAVLSTFVPLIETEGVKNIIIDPLIKLTRPKEYVNNDAMWAAYVSSLCVDFAKKYDVYLTLVLHQLTPKIQEDGTYMKPDKYSIKSGGNFSDSADNVLFIHKTWAPKDNESTEVMFGSLKIKKHKLVAIPNQTVCKFDRRTNGYTHAETNEPLFDFKEVLDIPKIKLKKSKK